MKSKKGFIVLMMSLGLMIVVALGILLYVNSYSRYYVSMKEAPKADAIFVLGAGVRDGKPTLALADRLDNAVQLYKAGKSDRIIVSGDNSTEYYNEVSVMKKYLTQKGIKKEAIYCDYAGFNTYDSMYRAREIFEISSVLIATNEFHMRRSLYIARRLGLEAYGYPTIDKIHIYDVRGTLLEREFLAKYKAFLDVEILHRKPKFLGETVDVFSPQE